MIYVTGDTHGDIRRLSKAKRLKKGDTLIVCGDFGFLRGAEDEEKALEMLKRLPYTVLFVEGAHDRCDRLKEYPTVLFGGSEAVKIADNLYWLLRGRVYNVENKRIFAFGSGLSEHYGMLEPDDPDAGTLPTLQEKELGRTTLEHNGNAVDAVISYDAPTSAKGMLGETEADELNAYFDELSKTVSCDRWYFGRYHKDKDLTRFFRAVYKEVLPL